VPVVMHRDSPAPFADLRLQDGDMLLVGNLRLQRCTRRVTRATRCAARRRSRLHRDTLLIGATGRTTCRPADPEALYDSCSIAC